MAELTDDQVASEERFLKGLPRFNIGAFLMPPIWGPAHGFWITILYYPAWVFVDNMIYAAYSNPSVINIILVLTSVLILLSVTIAFAIVSQPIAAHRAEERGISRETYLRRQRIWAWVSAAIAVAMLALATWYNLDFRPYA